MKITQPIISSSLSLSQDKLSAKPDKEGCDEEHCSASNIYGHLEEPCLKTPNSSIKKREKKEEYRLFKLLMRQIEVEILYLQKIREILYLEAQDNLLSLLKKLRDLSKNNIENNDNREQTKAIVEKIDNLISTKVTHQPM